MHARLPALVFCFCVAFAPVCVPVAAAQDQTVVVTPPSSRPLSRIGEGPAKNFDYLLGQKRNLPQATMEQVDEANGVYDRCRADKMIANTYDCDCMSFNFLEFRRAYPSSPQDELILRARKMCANKADIAGNAYTSCVSWTSRKRSDFREYCECYANSYARTFATAPTDSIRGRSVLMTNALNACQDENQVAEQNSLQRIINSLKKSGLYGTLFPGSTLPPDETSPSTP